MMRCAYRVMILVLCCGAAAFGQSFPQHWPEINLYMRSSVTNLQSGGVVTNEPALGYIQYTGSNNTWMIYFPVGGIVTQVVQYVAPAKYLNVSGGLLTMSGDPTGGVNVVELIPATLTSAGFCSTDGTPLTSWVISQGSNPMRISRVASGLAIRNFGDSEYRDLIVRNLTVLGTNNIVTFDYLNIETNRITLNSDVTGVPVHDAYFAVCRGSSPTASVQWAESAQQWMLGVQGDMRTVGSLATQEVANAWPYVKDIPGAAKEAVSNQWPWVVAITPTQIHNWDSASQTYSESLWYITSAGYVKPKSEMVLDGGPWEVSTNDWTTIQVSDVYPAVDAFWDLDAVGNLSLR